MLWDSLSILIVIIGWYLIWTTILIDIPLIREVFDIDNVKK